MYLAGVYWVSLMMGQENENDESVQLACATWLVVTDTSGMARSAQIAAPATRFLVLVVWCV
ncbi:hypothetical protein GCM10009785_32150 [Brooklawnia cerclae]